jgi:voltage-gated potassium channel
MIPLLIISKRIDVVLWICSVPLLPMILGEFLGLISQKTLLYFEAYYVFLWICFVIDFILQVAVTKDKIEYFKTNWFHLLVVFTPVFGVFRAFRFMRLPAILFSDRLLSLSGSFHLSFLFYFICMILVALLGSEFALFFERGYPQAEILAFPDALWWSINYLTTTGAGTYRVFSLGAKIVGVFLMTFGFAIFSVLVALLVSFFMKENAKKE